VNITTILVNPTRTITHEGVGDAVEIIFQEESGMAFQITITADAARGFSQNLAWAADYRVPLEN
jgi:hypothetical protein